MYIFSPSLNALDVSLSEVLTAFSKQPFPMKSLCNCGVNVRFGRMVKTLVFTCRYVSF